MTSWVAMSRLRRRSRTNLSKDENAIRSTEYWLRRSLARAASRRTGRPLLGISTRLVAAEPCFGRGARDHATCPAPAPAGRPPAHAAARKPHGPAHPRARGERAGQSRPAAGRNGRLRPEADQAPSRSDRADGEVGRLQRGGVRPGGLADGPRGDSPTAPGHGQRFRSQAAERERLERLKSGIRTLMQQQLEQLYKTQAAEPDGELLRRLREQADALEKLAQRQAELRPAAGRC